MTFDEMFAQAKALLENASAKDTDTTVSVQFDVSGDGCGAFYAVVSADSDELTIEPFDYKDHDVLVSADSAALLDALRTAETAALDLAGEWEKIAAFRQVLATLPAPEEKKPAAAPKAEAAAPAAAEKKPAATAVEKKPEAVKPAAEAAEKKPAATAAEKKPAAAPAAKTAAVKPAAKPVAAAKPAASAKKPAASAARKSARKSK